MTLLPKPSALTARPKGSLTLEVWNWLVLGLFAYLIFFFVLPRKGVIFGDEGFYLDLAQRAAKGEDFSRFFPQAPFYLVETLLMKLGLDSYLGLRRFYYAFLLGAYFLFPLWLGGAARAARPLCMALGIGISLTSLFSYQNAPVLLALCAMAIHLRGRDLGGPGQASAWLAGVCLAVSGFLNFTLYPAAGAAILALFLLERRLGPLLPLLASFCLVTLCLLGWYLQAIGLANLFSIPDGHPLQLARFGETISYLFKWLAFWALVLFVLKFALLRLLPSRSRLAGLLGRAELVLMPAYCLYYFLQTLDQLLEVQAPKYVLRLLPVYDIHPVNYVSFFGMGLLCLALLSLERGSREYRRGLACACVIVVYWLAQTFFSDIFISLSGVFFCAPMAGLGYYLVLSEVMRRNPVRIPGPALFSLWLSASLLCGIALVFSLNWNHPGDSEILGPKVELSQPKFKGLLESPERAQTLDDISRAYAENGCSGKLLLTFRLSNLLNYLFENAHKSFGYILPRYYMQEKRLLAELQSGQEWCVLLSHNNRLFSDPEREKPLLDFLASHSERVQPLGHNPPRHLYDDFTLYVGPKKP